MALTLVLIGVIAVLGLVNLLMLEWPSLRALYHVGKLHGPTGLPVVGCLHILWAATAPEIMDIIARWADKYPRLTSFYAGGIPSILVQEPEDVQIILSSVNYIRKGVEYSFITSWLNEGLLTSDGSKWHSRRKLLTPTFHFRILDDSVAIMKKNTDKLLEKLVATVGRTINIEEYVTKCALNIIGESAMGIDLKAQEEEGRSYVRSVKSTSELVILRILSVWQCKEWIFRLSSQGRKFYRNLSTLHNFTDKVIQDRKAENIKSKQPRVETANTGRKVRKAFLDCLLDTQRTRQDELTDLDIREEVDTFMFEGHDTTSSAICFALWLLGGHPEEQEKVYQELREIYGDENGVDVTMAETHKMVYLEKVIKETLRLYPSVPYISRRLTQDCILEDGTVLPATSNCAILPYFLHRNTRYFPDPEKFDPERFSEENSVGRHPFVYIPFSAGPRNCIGQKFAMLEMKVTLAKILYKLRVESVTRRDQFKILPYLIIRPTVPLQVVFSLRSTVDTIHYNK